MCGFKSLVWISEGSSIDAEYLGKAGGLLWMQETDPELVASVGDLQHVEGQNLGDGQNHSHEPDQSHLHCFPQGDAHPLHTAPGSHRMVSAHRWMDRLIVY